VIERAEPAAASQDPVTPIIEREARQNLWAVAQQLLGEEERAALWLRYAENFSSDEIARTLGKSSIAVRVMLFRARKVLGSALEDHANRSPRNTFRTDQP
jgi:DNA-directed RNA polymerase specialized sigma24 family protein